MTRSNGNARPRTQTNAEPETATEVTTPAAPKPGRDRGWREQAKHTPGKLSAKVRAALHDAEIALDKATSHLGSARGMNDSHREALAALTKEGERVLSEVRQEVARARTDSTALRSAKDTVKDITRRAVQADPLVAAVATADRAAGKLESTIATLRGDVDSATATVDDAVAELAERAGAALVRLRTVTEDLLDAVVSDLPGARTHLVFRG